jgi:hypothetical protein
MTQKTLKWMLVLCSSLGIGETLFVPTVRATPSSGFTGSTITLGRFDEFDVKNIFLPEEFVPGQRDRWISIQRTKGLSDVYVQDNVWEPGGTTGWHTHPGHSLIIVVAGSVTVYEGDDPSCTPHVYTAGMGFVDEGGDHVHVIRNDGPVAAETIAVQLIPAGQPRRKDAPQPACPF